MTTTTKEHLDEENLVDAAAAAAEALNAKTLATIRPEQQRWDENQLAILRAIGVEDATQADVDLFFHYCRTTGLDPFRRQIYMIGRNTKVTEWVDDSRADNGRRKVEKWVTKYTIQTGIDGYRKNGREAAQQFGDTLAFEGPYFTGRDDFIVTDEGKVIQIWREVWHLDTPPHAAKYIVTRNGEAHPAIVRYDEFVQTAPIWEGFGRDRKKVGERPNDMWDKSPCNQTAKCAEALAWRRAYPDDFAGLILEDAAQPTVIDQDGNVEQDGTPEKKRPAGSGVGGVRAAREARQRKQQEKEADPEPQVVDAEVVDPEVSGDASSYDPSQTSPPDHPERRKWLNKMFAFFGAAGITKDNRDDRLIITRTLADRTDEAPAIESANDLTDRELVALCNQLEEWKETATLEHEVREILNGATLAEDGNEAGEKDQ